MWFYFATCSMGDCHKHHYSSNSWVPGQPEPTMAVPVQRTAAALGDGKEMMAQAIGAVPAAPSPSTSPSKCSFTWQVFGESEKGPWLPAFIHPLSPEKPRHSWRHRKQLLLALSPVVGPPRGGCGPVLTRGLWDSGGLGGSPVLPCGHARASDGSSSPCVWSPRGRSGRQRTGPFVTGDFALRSGVTDQTPQLWVLRGLCPRRCPRGCGLLPPALPSAPAGNTARSGHRRGEDQPGAMGAIQPPGTRQSREPSRSAGRGLGTNAPTSPGTAPRPCSSGGPGAPAPDSPRSDPPASPGTGVPGARAPLAPRIPPARCGMPPLPPVPSPPGLPPSSLSRCRPPPRIPEPSVSVLPAAQSSSTAWTRSSRSAARGSPAPGGARTRHPPPMARGSSAASRRRSRPGPAAPAPAPAAPPPAPVGTGPPPTARLVAGGCPGSRTPPGRPRGHL